MYSCSYLIFNCFINKFTTLDLGKAKSNGLIHQIVDYKRGYLFFSKNINFYLKEIEHDTFFRNADK